MQALQLRRNPIGQSRGDAEQVDGHEHHRAPVAMLKSQRFGAQRQRNALRRLRASGEPGHPQRSLRRDVEARRASKPRGHACGGARGRRNGRGGSDDAEEPATVHGARTGGIRFFVACSKAKAISIRRGSLHAVPVKLTPNGAGRAAKPSGNGTDGAFGIMPNGTITVG